MSKHQALIPNLLRAELVSVGDVFTAAQKLDLQAEVMADGKLMLNAWQMPLSLSTATQKAYEIVEYGLLASVPKLRRQNPLWFWTYEDQYTNRTEKLARLRELLATSSPCGEYCAVCADALGAGDSTEPLSEAFSFYVAGAHCVGVAPRRHFGDLLNMPVRDARAVEELLKKELLKALQANPSAHVKREVSAVSHAYYSISLPK